MTLLFNNISNNQKKKIYHILQANTVNYIKDINIISNINKNTFIAIIEEGKVELIYNDYQGNKKILNTLEKDSIFGNLLINITEEITCITKENTKVTYIDYDKITNNELIKNDYYIIFLNNLLTILEEEIRKKNERIEILTKKTTRDKLLDYFKIQSINKGSKTFDLGLSFTELANYLSIDRSAMTREIKILKDEGFIIINKKRVTLNMM